MAGQDNAIEQLAINTIRTLSMDAVQKANSGHPGTPMALAPVGYVLFNEVLRYDPAQPAWAGRDNASNGRPDAPAKYHQTHKGERCPRTSCRWRKE